MKLITEVELPAYPFQLDHGTAMLMMGSCFAEEIGRFLERYLFPVCINPFGVTYNPLSLLHGLKALTGKEAYAEADLDQHNGLWFSFDHYTKFSHPDREKALEGINLKFLEAKDFLARTSVLMITWGTAWVYRHGSTQRVVNNCHKIPAKEFTRMRLSSRQVIEAYEPMLDSLISQSPDIRILFTVSPVRHWKDGAHGNQLSKAVLLLAVESLRQSFPDHCYYFPSYEIVMDELRDYRYYANDMVHTNELATRYIWEKFSQVLIHQQSLDIIHDLEPLLRMRAHRPIRPEGPLHAQVVLRMKELRTKLNQKYPRLAWENWDKMSF
jgi:hypothetical protein